MAITNIALNKPATANRYVKPYTAARAVAGNTTAINRWLCNSISSSNPGTLMVDLGRPSVITSWVVKHMGSVAGWTSPNYNMCDFAFQGSVDGNSWYNIDSVVGNTVSITNRTISTLVVYRYVRLSVTKGLYTNNALAGLVEFEVYGYTSPYLSGLGVNVNNVPLTLTPNFAPQTANYATTNVANGTTSCNIVAIAQDPSASIKINNVSVTSGSSTPVALNVGSNTVSIAVTAGDGVTVQTYTIAITREQGASLTGLTVSSGALSPTFSSGTLNYTTPNIGYDTSSVNVTPTCSAGTTLTVNGVAATSGQSSAVAMNIGSNTITIVATNNGVSNTYKVTVIRASNPYLASVTGIPGLTFVKTTYTYNLDIVSSVRMIKIMPQAEDTNATVKVNGTVVPSGSSAAPITLVTGLNTVIIDVLSASGGDSRKYTFNLTKLA